MSLSIDRTTISGERGALAHGTYSIDTAKAIDNLVKNGVQEKQARAIVETFSLTQDELISKKDLDLVIEKLRTDLTGEIQKVREDLSAQMSSQFRWTIGIVLSAFLATFLGVIGLVIAVLNMAGGGAG